MDGRDEDIMKMMGKIAEHKLLVEHFTSGLMENVDAFCKGNDILINGMYKGTSFEDRFRANNKNIRLAALMLVQAMKESESAVDIENVKAAQLERALDDLLKD